MLGGIGNEAILMLSIKGKSRSTEVALKKQVCFRFNKCMMVQNKGEKRTSRRVQHMDAQQQ